MKRPIFTRGYLERAFEHGRIGMPELDIIEYNSEFSKFLTEAEYFEIYDKDGKCIGYHQAFDEI